MSFDAIFISLFFILIILLSIAIILTVLFWEYGYTSATIWIDIKWGMETGWWLFGLMSACLELIFLFTSFIIIWTSLDITNIASILFLTEWLYEFLFESIIGLIISAGITLIIRVIEKGYIIPPRYLLFL